MDDLIAFLQARLAENAATSHHKHDISFCLLSQATYYKTDIVCTCGEPARVLAEVDAKRRIIEMYEGAIISRRAIAEAQGDMLAEALAQGAEVGALSAVRVLASSFASHPDYREEWRP